MKLWREIVLSVSSALHRQFLWLTLACYVAGGVLPGLGLWMRDVSFGEGNLSHAGTRITLPMLMLAALLLNAGLGIQPAQLRRLPRIWAVVLAGLAANLVVPLVFTLLATPITGLWLDFDEVQSILLGMGLVASMPIASSSTAWSQNANGDMVLSLGLVLLSTVLSPLTTPLTLHAVGLLATGEYLDHLQGLAVNGVGTFLIICVAAPSLLGVFINWTVGESRLAPARPYLKLINSCNLLLLIYANASLCLPEALGYPDPDFLVTAMAMAVALCVLAFGSGWVVARLVRSDRPQQASLMFGLGMNNNGTGLVLASVALAEFPQIMLPIIAYNLVQHLVAGSVAYFLGRASTDERFDKVRRCQEERISHMKKLRGFAGGALAFMLVGILGWHVVAQPGGPAKLDADKIGQAVGVKATTAADGVVRVAWTRTDVKVTVDGMPLKPAAGLGSWAAFTPTKHGVMVMGDTVVFQDEVSPAMDAAFAAGLEVTALHNHFFFDEPKVYFMHIGGQGEPEKLASGVKSVWEAIKKIRAEQPKPANQFPGKAPAEGRITAATLEKILGHNLEVYPGVAKATIGREGAMHGVKIGGSMGLSTWAAFSGSDSLAAVDGDFIMTANEVQTVLRALRKANIHIVALHNHMVGEVPAFYFTHFWAKGPAEDLARAIKSALDAQKERTKDH